MLIGKKNILKWFDDSKGNYWYIYNYGQASNGANIAYQSDQDDNITHERARNSLEDALSILNGRFDLVSTETASRKPKGDWKITFQINQAEERVNAISGFPQQPVMQGISEDEVEKRIQKALQEHEQKKQLNEALERIKELEKENKEYQENDPWNKIGEVAIPLLHRWLGNMPAAAQVAGFPVTSTEQPSNAHFEESTSKETVVSSEFKLTDEEETRLANVITILHAIAPNIWLNKLERLAAMVQANPAMLNMIN